MALNMNKVLINGLLLTMIGCALVACEKPQARADKNDKKREAAPQALSRGTSELIASIHWVGKQHLSADTNAGPFLAIWNLPESTRLLNQTLDKLALAPWRMREGWTTNTPATNYSATLIRPLVDDLVNSECFFEASQASNSPVDCVLALRLDDTRARLWTENLQKAMEDLTGIKAVANPEKGWVLTKHDHPDHIELARAGNWTLLACSQGPSPLLTRWTKAILAGTERSGLSPSNYWVDAELDLGRVARFLGIGAEGLAPLPSMTVGTKSDGDSVRTYGKFKFPQPLHINLDSWQIPTNMVSDPLVSFTAVRGIHGLLARLGSSRGFPEPILPTNSLLGRWRASRCWLSPRCP